MGMGIYFGPNTAPGAGRFLEYIWNQQGAMGLGTTAVASTALTKGGAGPTGNFWALAGAPVMDNLNGIVAAKFPLASGGQTILNAPFPVQDVNGELASLVAPQSIQQQVHEWEIAAASAGPAPSPVAYASAFYLLEGLTRPANGPGNGSAFTGIGFGLANGVWELFSNGQLAIPTVYSRTSQSALAFNTLALQIIRPSKQQPGAIQWWINGSKLLTRSIASLPAFQSPSSFTLSCNIQVANPAVLLYVRAARVIMGPLDPSVYPV